MEIGGPSHSTRGNLNVCVEAEGRVRRSGNVARVLIPVLFCIAAAFMVHHPMVLTGFDVMQVDPGDTRLNNYLLEHTYRFLTQSPGHESFWDVPFFYPQKNVGAFSDVLLSVSPPYVLFRTAGFEPDTSLQLWMVVLTVLNFVAGYFFLRICFSVQRVPAALGATLFSAACSRVAQLGHQQMMSQVFIVLCFIALYKLFSGNTAESAKAGRVRWKTTSWIVAFFAAGVAQCYAGFYNAFFLAFTLTLALGVVVFMPSLRRRGMRLVRGHWPVMAGCALVGILLLLPLFLHYAGAAGVCGARGWEEDVVAVLPRPQSWFYMGNRNWFYASLADVPLFAELQFNHEHAVGIGFLTLGVAGAGLVRNRRRTGVRLLLAVSVLIVLSATFWPAGLTVWRVVYDICPGAAGVRTVCRIGLLLLIPASVGLALFVRSGGRRRTWWQVPLVLLCLLEQGQTTATFDKHESRRNVADIAARVDRNCRAFYATVHNNAVAKCPEWEISIDALWAQMHTGVPTVNGYAGKWPPDYGWLERVDIRHARDLARTKAALRRWTASHGLAVKDVCWIRINAADRIRYAYEVLDGEVRKSVTAGCRALHTRVKLKNVGVAAWHPFVWPPLKATTRLRRRVGDDRYETVRQVRRDLPARLETGEVLDTAESMDLSGIPPGKYRLEVGMIRVGRLSFEDFRGPPFVRNVSLP